MPLQHRGLIFFLSFLIVYGLASLYRHLFFQQKPWGSIRADVRLYLTRVYRPLFDSPQDLKAVVDQNIHVLLDRTYQLLLRKQPSPFVALDHPLRRDSLYFAFINALLRIAAYLLLGLSILSTILSIYRF